MKKRVAVLASVLLIATMLGGCGHNMKENVKLTDRQYDILLSEDLPTDWNKLTVSQRNSIQAIEEMLEYVENKYDKTFIYAGYRRPDFTNADGEALLVYAEGDDPDTDCFTVERTDDGFEDNYGGVLAYDGFQNQLEEAVADLTAGKTVKLIASVDKVDDSNNVVYGGAVLVFEASEVDDTGLFSKEIEKRLYEIDGVDDLSIYYVKNTPIESMTKANWEEILDTKNIVDKSFTVSEDYE